MNEASNEAAANSAGAGLAPCRRGVLQAAVRIGGGLAVALGAAPPLARAGVPGPDPHLGPHLGPYLGPDGARLERLLGRVPALSARVRLQMPPAFANGYTVPLTLDIDSAMTASDHVAVVRILAWENPIVAVAEFRFTPLSGRAHVSTRIRLAAPQYVYAVAEMGDGAALMARSWVKVDANGCA